jgi:DNA-binding transcriptional LysR family regulator
MDRFESMTTFAAVVECGSLSAAGRRLGMPLATVSRKLSELEQHLRTRLLNRSSRRISLTDAGRAYLGACERILHDLGEAERAASGEYSSPRGQLNVTAPIVLGRIHLLPIAAEFLQVYPDIDVRIILSDRMANLVEETVDVAVRVGELPDSSLVATRVGAIRRVVCGSPAYLARRGIPKHPSELRSHDCVSFEGLSAPREWSFKGPKGPFPVALHSRLVVNTAEAAIDAAVASVGVTRVLSYQVAAAESAGALVRVLQPFEPRPTPINLVYAGQPTLPLKVRAFLEFSAPRLKTRLNSLAASGESS